MNFNNVMWGMQVVILSYPTSHMNVEKRLN